MSRDRRSVCAPAPPRGLIVWLPIAVVVATVAALSGGSALAALPTDGGQTASAAQSPVTVAPAACVVPDLRGRTIPQIDYSEILDGLVGSGNPTHLCSQGPVTLRRPIVAAKGQPEVVVSQSPRPGLHVPYYSPVSLVLAPARRPSRPGVCHLFAGTDAVARSASVVVYRSYQETDIGGDAGLPELKVRWRACVRPNGARRTIFAADRTGEGYVDAGRFVIAGRFVAHTVDGVESKYTGSDSRAIVVFDLATGKQTAEVGVGATNGPGNDPPGALPVPDVASLVVNAQGSIGWVDAYPSAAILYVHDAAGTRAVAVAGPGGISGLALHGDALSWDAAGVTHSSQLG
jgi:hypothetical protein